MQDCFLFLYNIALSLSKKPYPELDLGWLISPPQSVLKKLNNRKFSFLVNMTCNLKFFLDIVEFF